MDENIIPFYGGEHPELFEIERRCMDRDGKVIGYLNQRLPQGRVLDIGAGNGFTAEKLCNADRTVVALEPVDKMIDLSKKLIWVRGVAQELPFHDDSFEAVYATWAFFFASYRPQHVERGIQEVSRVVQSGGKIIIVDNAGGDEFSALSSRPASSDEKQAEWWDTLGFDKHIVETSFRFDSMEEARRLLGFYFGENGKYVVRTEFSYRVAVYEREV